MNTLPNWEKLLGGDPTDPVHKHYIGPRHTAENANQQGPHKVGNGDPMLPGTGGNKGLP